MRSSTAAMTFLVATLPAIATNYKMNEYKDKQCQDASWTHARPGSFCGDIDGTTHSVYVNTARKSQVVFWSGAGCGGVFLYSKTIDAGCIVLNGDEHSMGFA